MIKAVTAILVCGNEVFIIKRQPHLRAFPGYHAFPGGKIEADDGTGPVPFNLSRDHPDAHLSALHRELNEELEFDLSAAVKDGEVRDVALFGTAITPEFERIRFCAYYYKIQLSRKPDFVFDSNEISEGGWYSAAQLCQQYQEGRALMVVPMRNTLFSLAQDMSVRSCEPFNISIPTGKLACVELIGGLRTIPVPSNTLPPAMTTNALLLGDPGQRQVLVDPSPKSDEVYGRLLNTLSGRVLDAILISHHHPDHHERAFELARDQGLPVLASAITFKRLKDEYGETYFEGVRREIVAEGSEITCWKSEAVRAFELPGHDDGMLGLAPDSLGWFFVADLVQSIGSVVIPDRGGDLVDYLASLQRVIDLNPDVVLPSHGIPMGGIQILERAIQHRLEREAQIRPLYEAGMSTEDILARVYPALDKDLQSLAKQTIHQHLRKLRAETSMLRDA